MKKILYSIGLSLIILALVFSVAGCQGERGPEGLQGAQGIQGVQGNPGTTGAVGPQGAKGDTGEPGTPITWMGTATSAPKSWRVLNYAYYNSHYGKSYIWDGKYWQILAMDGKDGYPGATGATGATGVAGAAGAAGATGAQGPIGPDGPQGLVGQIVAESSNETYSPNHGPASSPYQTANVAGSVVLGEGDWMIVASGAFNVTDDGALNVGLRIGEGEAAVMLAKSNILSSADTATISRMGFALVGTVSVSAGQTLQVDLVHYGGGYSPPFEWNIVAIGGMAP